MDAEISKIYGNRFRTRACGLCWREGKLLMVKHSGLNAGHFWSPPGGGIEFGKTAHETLAVEFQEETKISIEPARFLFVCEFMSPPLHAMELFFEVFYKSGEVSRGFDPEMDEDKQIIQEARWLSRKKFSVFPKKLFMVYLSIAHTRTI